MDLYQEILTGLRSQAAELFFRGIQPERIEVVFRQVFREHPELFWVKSGYELTEWGHGEGISVQFHPRYYRTTEENRKMALAMEDAVRDVLAGMRPGISDWEKALFLHDWIEDNSDYDTAASKLPGDVIGSSEAFDCYNAYGVLVNHRAVCAGYSRAFQLLTQRVGIECLRVQGGGRNGGLHEWNVIRLNGRYYHVDVTWDDPVYEGMEKNVCRHDYFCVPTSEIKLTHTIDESAQRIPVCLDNTADYYHKKGLFFPQYSYFPVARVITERAALGSVEVKFGSEKELRRAVTDLVERERFFLIQGISEGYNAIRASVSSSKLVLLLEWSR